MIKNITVTNHVGESVKLNLGGLDDSGFLILGMDGLGPGKAIVNMTDMVTMDGAVFNSARISQRNIVLKLGFLWAPTIEAVRQKSYKYFPLKKKITLTIETDYRTSTISGIVESNEPDIFSKQEGTTISILCSDPYFYSVNPTTILFSGTEPMFEFEFENLASEGNTLLMGDISTITEKNIFYTGDAEVGVVIRIHAMGSASNILIYNTATRDILGIDTDRLELITGSGIIAGDGITISTIKGGKYITLLRQGIEYNIINCLGQFSKWFSLANGDNIFAYTAETGLANLGFTIEHRTLYGGI